MAWQPWANTGIGALPAILAGPILRRTLPNAVTVWVALKEACNVSLEVTGGGASLTGSGPTIRLANHVHVAAITATTGAPLPRDRVYQYNVTLSGGATGSLLTPGILSNGGIGPTSVGPGGAGLPSFALPPVSLNQLRIIHASCRKAHGAGRDPTSAIDTVIAATAQSHENRPHMLFLTGDQIYADDVAGAMLVMAQDAGTALGFNVENPQLPPGTTVLPTAGLRSELMKQIGMTSGEANSHLIRFAEFACMYLFAWSDVLWRGNELPTLLQVYDTGESTDAASSFEREKVRLLGFRQAIPAVRRVLANVPTYMMFDDHEITDDWFLDRQWIEKSNQDQLFRRIIQNGVAAYAAFQGWGNDPNAIQATKGGSTLTASLQTWANNPNNTAQSDDLGARLGLPVGTPGNQAAYPRSANAVNWHYSYVDSALPFRVAVLDTRTRRQYGVQAHDAPGLIAFAELANQLAAIATPSSDGEELIVVISPGPVVGYPAVEFLQGQARHVSAYFPDPEFWPRHPTIYQQFLAAVGAPHAGSLRRVVFLSGDVHYGFTSALRYRATTPIDKTAPAQANASFVQLCCSALKNEDKLTTTLQWASRPLPIGRTFGWNNPGGGAVVIGQLVGINLSRNRNPIIFDAPPVGFTPSSPTNLPPGARVPDWTTETIFSRSTADRQATLPTPVPAGDPQLQDHLAVLSGHATYTTKVAAGKTLVGKTNVGQLTLNWGSGNDKFVTHELFWFDGAAVNAGILSAYSVRMDLS